MNRTRLTMSVLAALIAAVVVVVVATSGGSAKTRPAVAPGSAISLRQTALGKTLVDANGRTLYLFEADKPNVSTLSAAGLAIWPPFTASAKPRATNGVNAARIGTITGAGGSRQVTYNGHPLYYYVGDHNPGQTQGQGLNQFGALWYVLSANGGAITSAPSSTATNSSASGSSSGGGTIAGY
jgi:predicted lipoprotein with Yx(FWY)xxD motif